MQTWLINCNAPLMLKCVPRDTFGSFMRAREVRPGRLSTPHTGLTSLHARPRGGTECQMGTDFPFRCPFTRPRGERHWARVVKITTHDTSGRMQEMAFVSADQFRRPYSDNGPTIAAAGRVTIAA